MHTQPLPNDKNTLATQGVNQQVPEGGAKVSNQTYTSEGGAKLANQTNRVIAGEIREVIEVPHNSEGSQVPQVRKLHDPTKVSALRKPQVIMIGDSTTQHVNDKQFFGYRTNVAIRRVHTVSEAIETTKVWQRCDTVQHCIVHLGVHDIIDTPEKNPTRNLCGLLGHFRWLYPNAQICFSEILEVGGFATFH
jgi:hypothetical protein